MADESIFRFFSVRAAKLRSRQKQQTNKIFVQQTPATAFQASIQQVSQAGGGRDAYRQLATQFAGSALYVKDPRVLPFNLSPVSEWFVSKRHKTLGEINVKDQLKDLYNKEVAQIVALPEFVKSTSDLADTIIADSILAGDPRPETILPFKLLFLFKAALAGIAFLKPEDALERYMTESVVAMPVLAGLRAVPPAPPPPPPPTPTGSDIRVQLERLEVAHRELSIKATDERYRQLPGPPPVDLVRNTAVTAAVVAAPGDATSDLPISGGGDAASAFVLSPQAYGGLKPATKAALTELDLGDTSIKPVAAVKRIEDEITFLQSQLSSSLDHTTLVLLGGVVIDKNRLRASLALDGTAPGPNDTPAPRPELRCGVGDLLMVRQTLKAYEVGEFAHVENVLKGEFREREHRRLESREDIAIDETEQETEKDRDLQTTERNELQNEAEKQVKSEVALDAGLQISGSYGPSVSFSSSLNASFSVSTEEAQRQSSSYSRDVTQRTTEKIRERVRTERRSRTLTEVQEINKHGINNAQSPTGPVRGVYRWLNKVYDAQVFNYGQRMMFDLVVPEPAAYFLYALVENPPKEQELVKPEPPTYLGKALKPSNLTRANYADYVSKYEVADAPPPPSQFLVVSHFDHQDGKEETNVGHATKLTIPPGYAAHAAVIGGNHIFTKDKPQAFRVMVGGLDVDHSNYWGSSYQALPNRVRGELAIGVSLLNVRSFALTVDVYCDLADDGEQAWQHKMYDAIMDSYARKRAEYESKLAELSIQQGPVQILGRNPLENQRIQRDELKKLAIMMFRNSGTLDFNAYTSSGEPVLSPAKAIQNAAEIQFFENAFEWNNLVYVLYPYFWGRKSRWQSALHFTDPDLDFAAFLKAGAARVQVPVRPGFERAVAYYCQFGTVWQGNEPPVLDDELYVPIIDEITENLGRLDQGVPYPAGSEPWEVNVPTSLVVLQNLDEVPAIRDMLTGDPIDID